MTLDCLVSNPLRNLAIKYIYFKHPAVIYIPVDYVNIIMDYSCKHYNINISFIVFIWFSRRLINYNYSLCKHPAVMDYYVDYVNILFKSGS